MTERGCYLEWLVKERIDLFVRNAWLWHNSMRNANYTVLWKAVIGMMSGNVSLLRHEPLLGDRWPPLTRSHAGVSINTYNSIGIQILTGHRLLTTNDNCSWYFYSCFVGFALQMYDYIILCRNISVYVYRQDWNISSYHRLKMMNITHDKFRDHRVRR